MFFMTFCIFLQITMNVYSKKTKLTFCFINVQMTEMSENNSFLLVFVFLISNTKHFFLKEMFKQLKLCLHSSILNKNFVLL